MTPLKFKPNRLAAVAGVTLIELIVTMFIASIAISGLVVAYVDGVYAWRRTSEKMVLYTEGAAVLSLIERFTQRSGQINTYSNVGIPSNKMDLMIPVKQGGTVFYRQAQFYYYTFDGSLRWNNMTGLFGAFNQKLLPMSSFNYRPGEIPYLQIQEASFTPYVPPQDIGNTNNDCTAVKIKLVLNDASGDTITLSSIVSKRNPPQ